LWSVSIAIEVAEGKRRKKKMDTHLAYLVAPEVIEMHRKQLEKEEEDAKDLVHLINSNALRALSTLYDNKGGAYPEHEYEGAAFLEYVEKLKAGIKEKKGKKTLLISNWDEWYGPIYTCPYCAEEKLMGDFKFCPNCGGDMKGFKFEKIEDEQERIKEENDDKQRRRNAEDVEVNDK
jgi:hypothetical protein